MNLSKKILIASVLATSVSAVHAVETLIDFEDQELVSLSPGISELTLGNVTFEGSGGLNNGIFGLLSGTNQVDAADYSGQLLANGGAGFTALKLSFANAVSDFSFNFGGNQSDWELEAFDTSGLSIGSLMIEKIVPLGSNNGKVFGLSSALSEGISYATLTGGAGFGGFSDTVGIDNFKYTEVEVSPIPEPSTYFLMLGGLGMVGFMAYRRRKTV
ncbi:hypothetical protein MNBD_GAMMA03-299 [hydrothermal vent metagenome]|uniref:Ice-binding protein C-terminal domain-containing protein n=1 Tax=hydrothermal vent metagenome TaxID=652676 RepID=A0A3B0W9T8_9ZZZZ